LEVVLLAEQVAEKGRGLQESAEALEQEWGLD